LIFPFLVTMTKKRKTNLGDEFASLGDEFR
jgi:hypothetical protein